MLKKNLCILYTLTLLHTSAFAQNLLDLRSDATQKALEKLKKQKVSTVYDPAYKSPMLFWGYSCKEVLHLSSELKNMHDDENIVLEASDGYKIRASLGVLKDANCFLSNGLAEKSTNKVLPFKQFGHGKEASNPGPNYIVWKNGDDRIVPRKPWPWALVALHKEEMDDTLIRPKDSKLNAGYKLYKEHCIACHSINMVGGQVGFEMNIPKNITEYRSYEFFSSFVVAPESYRAQSKMPARKLSEADLRAIWDYLKGKAGEKI